MTCVVEAGCASDVYVFMMCVVEFACVGDVHMLISCMCVVELHVLAIFV